MKRFQNGLLSISAEENSVPAKLLKVESLLRQAMIEQFPLDSYNRIKAEELQKLMFEYKHRGISSSNLSNLNFNEQVPNRDLISSSAKKKYRIVSDTDSI